MNPFTIATVRNWIGVAAASVAAVVALTSCSTATSQSTTFPAAPAAVSAQAINGSTVTIPAADKATAMIFYSVGCGTCIGITQQLAKIATEHPTADYYAVNLDPTEDVRTSNGFLGYINSPQIIGINDTEGTLTKAYGVNSVSTVVIVDKDQQVIVNAYEPTPEEIKSAIAQATA